jgi:anti-sigma B factor antagonist
LGVAALLFLAPDDGHASGWEEGMDVSVDVRPDGAAVMRLVGRLDLSSAADVKQRLTRAIAEGHRLVVVDLDGVTFIDSSGLGALISGLKAARFQKGELRIARPGEQARVVLELTTLDRVLRPYSTVEEALAAD